MTVSPFESLFRWLATFQFMNPFFEALSSIGIKNVMFFKMMQATDETMAMTFAAGFWGLLIGLPIGVVLYITRKGEMMESYTINLLLSFVINTFRSIPFIILIVWMIPFTRAI